MIAAGVRHGHEANIRRTALYATGAFGLSLAGNVGHVALTTWEAWPVPWPVVAGRAAIAAIGPALIGSGLELANRRPPAVVGCKDLPLLGYWRDFPVVGYLAMMMIGFALSFDHLRSLSELVGVPDWSSWLIPVGIDLAAFSVTLDHSRSKRALDRLDAEVLEYEATQAGLERAAAESRQAAAKAERQAQAEREAAGKRISSRTSQTTSEDTSVSRKTKSATNSGGPSRGGGTASAIADYLMVHPAATAAEVASAVGVSDRTVKRSESWRSRPAAQPVTNGSTDTAEVSNR